MTLSPRGLRNATDSICLVLSVATGAVSIAALHVAGSEERIMSGQFGALICGTTFGWASTALAVTGAKPQSRYTSLRTTTITRGVLLVIGIALAGYQSTIFDAYRVCSAYLSRYSGSSRFNGGGSDANCQLPLASGILAWLTVAAIVALTKRYGSTRSTWGASLLELPNTQRLPEEDKRSLNV
ncbi:hypothetical protein A1Q2_03675 [Trichosporon asahii var. asahii CBS 8904]|uniref:Transmembrane protein n=1 Tax=Trichosporon asahii var. asahii (strain CBS 8904) TaxID=1220162 RepID=K1VDB6_TRIAC|nr:hypothetical protein A1Q2_03675 [Trichosporon asahii var. asahii CBS 8904]